MEVSLVIKEDLGAQDFCFWTEHWDLILKEKCAVYSKLLHIAFLRSVSGKQIKLTVKCKASRLYICFLIKVSISFSIDRNLLLYLWPRFSLSVCTCVCALTYGGLCVCVCPFPPVAALIYFKLPILLSGLQIYLNLWWYDVEIILTEPCGADLPSYI